MNLENSQNYYGEVLGGSSDLRTDACCTLEAPPLAIRMALGNVHDEVKARYYGCGLVVPQAIEGAAILDLGSGAGQDAYLLAQMVGEQGSVTGIDATAAQLAIATRHLDWHSKRFGYARSNVRFVEGDIERLDALDLTPASFDAIVSNCVINLVTDKAAVLRAASGLLKPGGELYFSDVYAERRVPEALRSDPVLHGECLSGALYWGDFTALAKGAGFADPRLVTSRPLAINDGDIAARLAGIAFIRRPIACSSSTRSSRSARITGRPCAIPKDPRIGDDISPRRPPRDRGRTHFPGVRQYPQDARRNALRGALRLLRGLQPALWRVCRVRRRKPVPSPSDRPGLRCRCC